jgi:molybdate transport system ATP-binding protein
MASYLFPHLAPEDPEFAGGYRGLAKDGTKVGYVPEGTRLAPLAAPYDAEHDHALLAELEAAITTGEPGRLLRAFGCVDVRHRPVFAMSTGEARKMLLLNGILAPARMWVLDETLDGLDARSRTALRDELAVLLESSEWRTRTLALITHHKEEIMGDGTDLVLRPTHGLLLGQGPEGTGWTAGEWSTMEPMMAAYFQEQKSMEWTRPAPRKRIPSQESSVEPQRAAEKRTPLVDFRAITIQYNSHVVFDQLSWMVREGEKWVVLGGNGTGKSTLVELITGDNVLGYQCDVHLFGRKKGSGESIWDIKSQLGVLSTEFHMAYIDHVDPSVRTAFRSADRVTTWEVVCSGFFDSMGLYQEVSLAEENLARDWIDRFDLHDLVTPPPRKGSSAQPTRQKKDATGQDFFHLSHGQQKLVLLCRAMVKNPRLLLLDEPTHGLSGHNKERLLYTLSVLADDPNVAVVYVTHRQEEIDALGFDNVLQLGATKSDGSYGAGKA